MQRTHPFLTLQLPFFLLDPLPQSMYFIQYISSLPLYFIENKQKRYSMGNLAECGDICKSTRLDKFQIPPLLDNDSECDPIEDPQSIQIPSSAIKNPNESVRKTRMGQLLDQQIPTIELKVEQNHMIVPVSLVKQRISKKLSSALGEELAASNFQDDSKWFLLPSGNYYNGELRDNEPYGVGTFLLPNMIFFGSVRNRKPEGEGSILAGDFEFKGKFERGRATGEGELLFNSCYLKGLFRNGKIEKGKLSCLEYQYEGEFSNGQPHGMGQYHSNNHTQCFIGEFSKGNPVGVGMRKCQKGKLNAESSDQKTQKKKRDSKSKHKSKTCKNLCLC